MSVPLMKNALALTIGNSRAPSITPSPSNPASTPVHQDIGQIIVANVNASRVSELLDPDRQALGHLIAKQDQLVGEGTRPR